MLTDAAIRRATRRATTYRLYDSGGLYLEIPPSGSMRWRLKYRVGLRGAKREKRVSLGVYPTVTLAMAREKRDEARVTLARGIDPSGGSVEAVTFGALATEWVALRKPGWSETHARDVESRLDRNVLPFFGKLAMAEVTAPRVLEVVRRVERRGAIETARRLKTIIGQVCKYAMATGRAEADPTAAITRDVLAPQPRVKHHAAPVEPEHIGELLRAIDGYRGSVVVRAALRLGPLVFVRPGELRQAEWLGIDLDAAMWTLTASKTAQPHIVPLSRQAVAILREIATVTGDCRWVFPSPRALERPMSNMAVNAALRRVGITTDELTGHGWRATARTVLVERLGWAVEVVEHQLAHAVRDMHGRAYNRTQWLAERTRMMQAWADWLDEQRTAT